MKALAADTSWIERHDAEAALAAHPRPDPQPP
ncbi:hypothetical protein GA0115254_115611 [Streptomyces sp. Ncost-T10-10d]|nr:hypothetical protein GA0115254_115611 [Streptomyces sp. Ncost-T10-10d]